MLSYFDAGRVALKVKSHTQPPTRYLSLCLLLLPLEVGQHLRLPEDILLKVLGVLHQSLQVHLLLTPHTLQLSNLQQCTHNHGNGISATLDAIIMQFAWWHSRGWLFT
jgi:hypothetical protein